MRLEKRYPLIVNPTEYWEKGFSIGAPLMSPDALEEARREADVLFSEGNFRGGVRSVLRRSHYFNKLAEQALAPLASELLQGGAEPIKGTLFDKSPDANWKVPWHQDLTITVRERLDVEGFGPWSLKTAR